MLTFINTPELARLLGTSVPTLGKWFQRADSPKPAATVINGDGYHQRVWLRSQVADWRDWMSKNAGPKTGMKYRTKNMGRRTFA